jgi:hypothetical protein
MFAELIFPGETDFLNFILLQEYDYKSSNVLILSVC